MKRKIVYIDNFLTKHGHTPTIGLSLAALLSNEGYEVIKASTKKAKLLRLLDMLYVIFKERKGAVVLISTYSSDAFYFALACSWMCRLLNIKYIPCLHGGNLPQRIQHSTKMSRQLFANSYMNVAVSGYLEDCIKKNGWRVAVIPNVIHINEYPFLERKTCKPRLLWVRSFHEIYNPGLAIKVLFQLLKTNPDATLAMVGPDKDGSLAVCKQLAAELNVTDKVNFTGLLSRNEWIELSTQYDIFINTTNFDNLPVSIIEALALGMPIVSTNVGGLQYLIADRQNGLLVNANGETGFVEAINTLIHDNTMAEGLSRNARLLAEQFDWDHVKQQWNTLLQGV